MGESSFNPDLPRNNSVISSMELRDQFNGLNDTLRTDLGGGINGCALNPASVSQLGLIVSSPPTDVEVQAIVNKLDELIAALTRT